MFEWLLAKKHWRFIITGVASTGTISTEVPNVSGPVWDAAYDMFVNPNNPNIINYNIAFFKI
ncbi:hypothetical protein [Flavobacterium cerinum]|uniref:Uncharacterized protein n=1 Tax=Flavobacterium cerinum TaxID=2502784 RepID=A0A3S4T3Z5_9FLAO|nr:hypothetical protein [Flavobacterium cerinum]RWX03647.1 hypothetical protein EPI11_01600 [Flavobacterium cerinum]